MAGLETSCKVRAPPGENVDDGARGPQHCPTAVAPGPERRRVARCNDYPTDAHGWGERGETY